MAYLRIVERRESEVVRLARLELNVELAAGLELARDFIGPLAVFPLVGDGHVAPVALKLVDDVGSHLVAGLELAVIERNLVAVLDVISAAGIRRLAVLVHEFGFAVHEAEGLVVRTARIALAP